MSKFHLPVLFKSYEFPCMERKRPRPKNLNRQGSRGSRLQPLAEKGKENRRSPSISVDSIAMGLMASLFARGAVVG